MLSAYPAYFVKEGSGYSVLFPDLNHLATCGDTLDEALQMAVDYLAGYLYWLKRDGEPFPPASVPNEASLAAAARDAEAPVENAFVNLVTVDADEYARTHFEKRSKRR